MAIINTDAVSTAGEVSTRSKLLKVLGINSTRDLYLKPQVQLEEENDGKEYINIGIACKTSLGNKLRITNPLKLTLFGHRIGSMSNFMDCLNIEGYPMDLLANPKPTREDIKKITSLNKIQVPNFLAILAFALSERIKIDAPLQEEIMKNELPYVYLTKRKEINLFGKSAALTNQYLHNNSMAFYLAILEGLVRLLKANQYTRPMVMEYVNLWIKDPNSDLLAGVRPELVSNIK